MTFHKAIVAQPYVCKAGARQLLDYFSFSEAVVDPDIMDTNISSQYVICVVLHIWIKSIQRKIPTRIITCEVPYPPHCKERKLQFRSFVGFLLYNREALRDKNRRKRMKKQSCWGECHNSLPLVQHRCKRKVLLLVTKPSSSLPWTKLVLTVLLGLQLPGKKVLPSPQHGPFAPCPVPCITQGQLQGRALKCR